MTFKTLRKQAGIDTTTPMQGILSGGVHRVTITDARTVDNKLQLTFENQFGESTTTKLIINAKDGTGFSKKLQDLLNVLDLSVIKSYTETQDAGLLVHSKLRIAIRRTVGDYIEKRGIRFVLCQQNGTETIFNTYNEARDQLNQERRAYWEVAEYLPFDPPQTKGVW